MIQRPLRSLVSSTHAAFAVAILAVSAACWLPPAAALAQASDAAATASLSGQTYAVKPGQSLNDIAGDITGSKDRDVRQKMARQLFDANPNAFGGHDINKLKLGAVLNVPATDGGGASASTATVASAPAVVPEVASAPAQTAAAASESAAVASAPAVQEASSVTSTQPEPASEPAPAVVASAPVSTPAVTTQEHAGPDPALYGAAVTLLIVLALFFKWRSGKRARAVAASRAAAVDPAAPRTFATLEEAQADADARNRAVQEQRERESRANEAAQARVAAASQAATVDREEAPPASSPAKLEPVPSAPPQDAAFQPVAPAAHHPAFVPPPPQHVAEPVDVPKPETQDVHASETAAREALARDLHAREMQLRDAEAREASQEEVHAQLARDAAAREINAHGAELRAAQAEAAEQRAEEQRDLGDDDIREDEQSPAPRFPMPKFAQEAVQALGSLELGLPPRMELTLNLPSGTVTSHGMQPEPARPAMPAAAPAQVDPAPFTPEPVAETSAEIAASHIPTVASEIEAGTAGAASVAGLGATQFPPLSMDFNAGLPKSSHTGPLPAMTTAQLAAIARNKLELAGEYIELGDLPGARTLLQEVIASNDPATRQRAASLLSTLAPHA